MALVLVICRQHAHACWKKKLRTCQTYTRKDAANGARERRESRGKQKEKDWRGGWELGDWEFGIGSLKKEAFGYRLYWNGVCMIV
jgi:hypothetical protein